MEQTQEPTERQKEYTALLMAKYEAENLEEKIECLKEDAAGLRARYEAMKAEYYEKYPEDKI